MVCEKLLSLLVRVLLAMMVALIVKTRLDGAVVWNKAISLGGS